MSMHVMAIFRGRVSEGRARELCGREARAGWGGSGHNLHVRGANRGDNNAFQRKSRYLKGEAKLSKRASRYRETSA